jgi:uncharacterized SAM-binding protein YcdF (DUF218 family)
LPPGIFIIILTIAGIYSKKLKKLFFFSAFFLYLISIKPISNILLLPLENFNHKDNISPKAVVVLGGGVNPRGIFKASAHAFKREMYGIILAKKYDLPFVFTGGGNINEAEWIKKDVAMFERNFNFHIKTLYENKSLNTYQNAKYTSTLFKKLRLKKEILLVTSAYHMKRAYLLFKKFHFKIITKPVDFLISPVTSVWDFFPSEESFYKSYLAIHEYFGILSLIFR